MKPTLDDLLRIYRANLAVYVAADDQERVRVQTLMIEGLEAKRKAMK